MMFIIYLFSFVLQVGTKTQAPKQKASKAVGAKGGSSSRGGQRR